MTTNVPYLNFEYHPVTGMGDVNISFGAMDLNTQPGQIIIPSLINEKLQLELIQSISDFYRNRYRSHGGSATIVTGNPWHTYPTLSKMIQEGDDVFVAANYANGKERSVKKIDNKTTVNGDCVLSNTHIEFGDYSNVNNNHKNMFVFRNNPILSYSGSTKEVYQDFLFSALVNVPRLVKDVLEQGLGNTIDHISFHSAVYSVEKKKGKKEIKKVVEGKTFNDSFQNVVIKDVSAFASGGKAVDLYTTEKEQNIEDIMSQYIDEKPDGKYLLQVSPLMNFDKTMLLYDSVTKEQKSWHVRGFYHPENNKVGDMLFFKMTSFEDGTLNNTSSGRDSIMFFKNEKGQRQCVTTDVDAKLFSAEGITQTTSTITDTKRYSLVSGRRIDDLLDKILDQIKKTVAVEQKTKKMLYDSFLGGKSVWEARSNMKEYKPGLPQPIMSSMSMFGIVKNNREGLSTILL